jgi:hypothetical protein
MKMRRLRVIWLCLALIMASGISAMATDKPLTGRSAFLARIVLPSGETKTVELQGVGCSESICSRVFIRAKQDSHTTAQVFLDSIAAIKNLNQDAAVFVMKDGSERRLGFIRDFRVLYVTTPNGGKERLDLGIIKSLEIMAPAK